MSAPVTLLSAHGLSKSYGSREVLDGVSLSLGERDRLGLIGRNGAGKTTLVRILAGQEDPDAGELIRRRGLSCAIVRQEPQVDSTDTIEQAVRMGQAPQRAAMAEVERLQAALDTATGAALDALVLEHAEASERLERLGGWNTEHRAEAMRDALSVPPGHRRVGQLSLGEQRRVALAIGLLAQPELLILDEPTNHLDLKSIEWLQAYLQSYPGAVLLITHDRYFLDEVSGRIAELDRGSLYLYEGNYTEHLVKKAERDAAAEKAEARRANAIRNELVWVRASAPARTTKQRARLERFDALVAARPKEAQGEVSLQLPVPTRIGKSILRIEDLRKGFSGRTLIDGLTLGLKRGDRIGIVGENGAGKTTLVKMILGQEAPDSGRILAGENTEIVYADQARSDLNPDNSVLEEVSAGAEQLKVGERFVSVQAFLEQLLFDGAAQRTKLSALSGGEKSRVSLAKSLAVAGNLLILDEPTNDLDLATMRVLEDALVAYPGCVLVISHDRYFLDRVSTAILAFEGQGRVTLYEGSYAMYRARIEAAPPAPAPLKRESKPSARPRAARSRRSFKEQREFEGIEEKIMAEEAAIEAEEAHLNDPAELKRLGAAVAARLSALEVRRAALEETYARWEALGELEAYGA